MNRAKTAELIEMPFRELSRVGPRNHMLDGGPSPLRGRGNFEVGSGGPLQSIGTL